MDAQQILLPVQVLLPVQILLTAQILLPVPLEQTQTDTSVQPNCIGCLLVKLARTIYIRCIYGIFCREFTKYTVIYGVYIRFWPTLFTRNLLAVTRALKSTKYGGPAGHHSFWEHARHESKHQIGMFKCADGIRQGSLEEAAQFLQ